MKRLLCIATSMNTGGAETFLMKIYRALDKSKYQMDFCLTDKNPGFYDSEILEMGGRIYYITKKTENLPKCLNDIRKVVKDNNYKYVMRISAQSLSVLDLIAAKLGGAKKIVYRSTNSGVESKKEEILNKIFFFLPRIIPNVKIAPSTEAAKFIFGEKCIERKKVFLLNNAIDTKLFLYNEKKRSEIRKCLNVENSIVIGHIGRFSEQKNHKFLLDIFKEILNIEESAKLLLVGTGEIKIKIEQYAKELGIFSKINFMGVRSDIPDLLLAFDIMVFPSFYEGMPNTIIEAQATGLKCIISDTITKEANISGNVEYLSLDMSAKEWAEKVLSKIEKEKRRDCCKLYVNKGYDIENVIKKFEKLIFE